jgi:peptide/nickel transport system substrate-binding protein
MKKIFVALLAMVLVLTACGPAASTEVAVNPTEAAVSDVPSAAVEGAVYGGTLRYGLSDEVQGWTPHNTESCQNMTVFAQIWSSLLRYDGNDQLVGDLAESWVWTDDLTVVFTLRPNVKWHNGDDLTADQVVLSMNHLLNPDVSMRAADLNQTIDHFEAVDPLTVKLVLKQANSSILRNLTTAPGQAFILHPNYSEDTAGQSFDTTIGTGPFMFESYEPGVAVKLVKNPNYFIHGLPYLDGMDFSIITDTQASQTALLAGDLDVIESVDFNSLASLKENPDIAVPEGFGFYGCRLVMESHTVPTDDINVRKALNFAVDRQMIVDSVLAGEGVAAWGGMIPEGRFGYAPDLANTYSYDPEMAKTMLAESGWTDSNADGFLDKDGQDLTINFVDYGPDWWSQVAEVVQANFLDIGVKTNLEIYDWATYKEKRAANKAVAAGEPGLFNVVGATLWGLDMVDMMQYNFSTGAYNFGRVNNPDLDALYLSALAATDDAARESLLQQAQAIEVANAYDIVVAYINRAEATRSYVKNFHHLNQDGCWGILLWEAYIDN